MLISTCWPTHFWERPSTVLRSNLMDSFFWTGDEENDAEPEWMIVALADGRASIENGGTPQVSLVIGTRRFARGSTIRIEDVED